MKRNMFLSVSISCFQTKILYLKPIYMSVEPVAKNLHGVLESCYTQFFKLAQLSKLPQSKAYLAGHLLQCLYTASLSHTQAAFNATICSCGYRHAHTYTHTHAHTDSLFCLNNQACLSQPQAKLRAHARIKYGNTHLFNFSTLIKILYV